jgi:hypothetical protein
VSVDERHRAVQLGKRGVIRHGRGSSDRSTLNPSQRRLPLCHLVVEASQLPVPHGPGA